ncbi:MAG: hypothetical protein ACTSV6_06690 [Candidatus Heimdallarchaeota archaeon]
MTVILVLGIVSLLFINEKTASSFKKVGFFASLLLKWMPGGKQFFVSFSVDENSFMGQSFKLSNSSFEGFGSFNVLNINGADVSAPQANIKIDGLKGTFEITRQGVVGISADASNIVLNNLPILNPKINIEMVPSNFTLYNFNQKKVVLASASGVVETKSGWFRNFNDNQVEIYNFKGNLKVANGQAFLEGLASKLIVDGEEVSV